MPDPARVQHLQNMHVKCVRAGCWRIFAANGFPVSKIFATRAEAEDDLERRRHDLDAMQWEDS